MTTALRPLTASQPKGWWKCIVCHKVKDASFDLITHKGCKEQCVFHRMCYPNSVSAVSGECQECRTPLYKSQAVYVASDSGVYQNADLAQLFRAVRHSKRQLTPPSKETKVSYGYMSSPVIRSWVRQGIFQHNLII